MCQICQNLGTEDKIMSKKDKLLAVQVPFKVNLL